MKNLVFALLATVLFCAPAYAMSEAAFQKLYNSSPVLQKADKQLNRTWKEVSKSVPKRNMKYLKEAQREWIKYGRDEIAQEYMDEGYGRACAYAISTMRQVKNLRVLEFNYNLSDDELGRAKADDAFWDEDNDIPAECRK